MDGRGELGSRNWEFFDHGAAGRAGIGVPRAMINGNDEMTSVKLSSFANRDAAVSPPPPPMNFWLPSRNVDFSPQGTASSVQDEPEQQRGKKKTSCAAASKKALRTKDPAKKSKGNASSAKHERNQSGCMGDLLIDLSSIPVPFCSCTGVARQCYRWGSGGWQSSCCTIGISEYPLPMSSSRPGARLAGRKMSIGAYKKLLQRFISQGHDLRRAVDLKEHWARHGTNKFVTIK